MIDVGLKFNGELRKRTKTTLAVLHHAAAESATVQQVHQWHLNNGWSGIGYHIYIDKQGNIFKGRPLDTVGAHSYGYNDISIGICAEGNFEKEKMAGVQKNAILSALKEIKKQYPNIEIKGHKDLVATACPGRNYPLNELKALKGGVTVTTEQAKTILKEKVGLAQETITFLLCYKYGDELVQKIAKAVK